LTIRIHENKSNSDTTSQRWAKVRFDALAENIVEHVEVPSESGYDRFVGGDHLDPGSLKITRWGSTDDVEAQKLLFKKGHILFGKRNAYLRKVAYADFDGVCSAHMLVLQAKSDYIIEEFLPFFMQTDQFWERALMISEGSMSPTIKWKILAQQKFVIPPKDEQQRIADILWALDEAFELHLKAIVEAERTLEHVIFRLMHQGLNEADIETNSVIICPKHWEIKTLQDIAEVERGKFAHRPRNLPRFYGGQYPFIQTGDVARNCGVLNSYEQTLSEEGKLLSRSFGPNSILMTIAAIIGKTTITPFEIWCPDSIVGIVPHDNMNAYFLEFYLRTIQKDLEEKTATQSAQKNINLRDCKRIR
jgi:type I restriction enzyme, S subunit